MGDRAFFVLPEIILVLGAVIVAVTGLSPRIAVRRALPVLTAATIAVSGIVLLLFSSDARVLAVKDMLLLPGLSDAGRLVVLAIGLLLVLLAPDLIDRRLEADVAAGRLPFDPLRASRGEFWSFFLLSLAGVLLVTGATDLIWLFLALELTSLPTYIMVAISRPSRRAQEASMKYFFLGALAAAIFLYGFSLLYGAAGSIHLSQIRDALAREGGGGALAVTGAILAILGVCYKIAAAPMYLYAADVYEGAASPVTAFLGFVPKSAGIFALMLLLSLFGGSEAGLPPAIVTVLWMVAVLTMSLGNIGALLQSSVKRVLAYSSIAHSGYMIIGLLAGPGLGLNSVLFYLFAYGVMNTGAFAVLAGLERRGAEIESVDDLSGLRHRHPAMAWAMALCAGSLLGFPPLLGFIGKLGLFMAGVEAGHVLLVVIAAVNSAISGWYYLRLVGLPILAGPSPQSETIERTPAAWPRVAALGAAIIVVVAPIFSQPLLRALSLDPAPEASAGPEVSAAAENRSPRDS